MQHEPFNATRNRHFCARIVREAAPADVSMMEACIPPALLLAIHQLQLQEGLHHESNHHTFTIADRDLRLIICVVALCSLLTPASAVYLHRVGWLLPRYPPPPCARLLLAVDYWQICLLSSLAILLVLSSCKLHAASLLLLACRKPSLVPLTLASADQAWRARRQSRRRWARRAGRGAALTARSISPHDQWRCSGQPRRARPARRPRESGALER